jgi:hypothetical protein
MRVTSVGDWKFRPIDTSVLHSLHFPANRLRLGPRFLSRSKVTVLDLSKGKVVEGVSEIHPWCRINSATACRSIPALCRHRTGIHDARSHFLRLFQRLDRL